MSIEEDRLARKFVAWSKRYGPRVFSGTDAFVVAEHFFEECPDEEGSVDVYELKKPQTFVRKTHVEEIRLANASSTEAGIVEHRVETEDEGRAVEATDHKGSKQIT